MKNRSRTYNHKIESKWQKIWQKTNLYKTKKNKGKKKSYVLDMFPYPSAEGLHVGHVRVYTASDVYARYRSMKGDSVLHPTGWDAFGLPAEQYALKNKIHPKISVRKNINNFREQMKRIGLSYDFSREVDTTDPKFYKWTQWIFLKLLEKGLAYQSYEPINWCPSCKTGLANEDLEDGKCERCGSVVTKKPMRQWVLRITKYADRILKDLDLLEWPESFKELQRNWIGRSEGAEIEFKISGKNFGIKVFTTRADTLFGATYMVLAPDHDILEKLKGSIKNWTEVARYAARASKKTEIERTAEKKDKTGVKLKGITALNPVDNKELPVFVADYVLKEYGTGAIMAVPAHDERDYDFARKFGLPIKHVVIPSVVDHVNPPEKNKPTKERINVHAIVYDPRRKKYLTLTSKKFDWNTVIIGGVEDGEDIVEAARREAKEETGYTDLIFKRVLGGPVRASYFARHKNENRVAITTAVYFELRSDKQVPRSKEEIEANDVVWTDPRDFVPGKMVNSELPFWLGRLSGTGETYIESGVLMNSGKFNGLGSEEVKKKIAEFVGGKTTVTYKIKDWVFSRQRYWGEPIPVIHCNSCKTRRALLIHGFEGTGDGHWFIWLKRELEKRGIKVFNPTLKTTNHPAVGSWVSELSKLVKDFGSNDLVIGHSLGSNAALQLAQKLNKNIGHLFLVGSAIGRLRTEKFWFGLTSDYPESDISSLRRFWESKIDYKKVNKFISSVTLVRSKDDPFIPKETHDNLPKNWRVEEWNGFGHFDFDGKPFPELLQLLEAVINDGVVPVPENNLPVLLPDVSSYEPTGTGESPLAAIKSWVNTKCPKCGGKGRRETNTMPQWAGSSWYYLRFIDPKNDKKLIDLKKDRYWSPVDMYVGGAEHATRHLIYARFWHKFLSDIGAINYPEPFKKLKSVGLVLGGKGVKMSKRLGNVVNPDTIIKTYGADTLRLYIMFMGPFGDAVSWDEKSMVGPRRFLERVWKLSGKISSKHGDGGEILRLFHNTIKKVSSDIEEFKFNTAISQLMVLANALEKEEKIGGDVFCSFLILLAPFAPHITEELWRIAGGKGSVHEAKWPSWNEKHIRSDKVTIAVQVNGKVRGTVVVLAGASEAEIVSSIKMEKKLEKWLAAGSWKKVVYVPGRLISVVVK